MMVNALGAMRMSQHSNSLDGLGTSILHFPQRLSHGMTTRLSQNRHYLSLLLVPVSVILRYADQPSSRRNKQAEEAGASSTVLRSSCAGLVASFPLTSNGSMMGGDVNQLLKEVESLRELACFEARTKRRMVSRETP